jgi:MSHA pilin protein MshA
MKAPAQHGVTLTELIVVVLLLGILMAVAIPRFINLREASLTSTMQSTTGAIKSAAHLVYAKAQTKGVADLASASVDISGTTVATVYGYPAGTAAGIDAVVQTNGWQTRASVFSGAWVYWHGVIDEDAGVAQCYLRYRQPSGVGQAPVVDVETSGC